MVYRISGPPCLVVRHSGGNGLGRAVDEFTCSDVQGRWLAVVRRRKVQKAQRERTVLDISRVGICFWSIGNGSGYLVMDDTPTPSPEFCSQTGPGERSKCGICGRLGQTVFVLIFFSYHLSLSRPRRRRVPKRLAGKIYNLNHSVLSLGQPDLSSPPRQFKRTL